jgi:hypothetical protein
MIARAARGLQPILLAGLFLVSIANLARFNERSAHWPLFPDDEISRSVRHAERVRSTFDRLGIEHAAYVSDDPTGEVGAGRFFLVQYAVVPTVLRRNAGDEIYVLVDNWQSGELPTEPDRTLVEDYGEGLALFRR